MERDSSVKGKEVIQLSICTDGYITQLGKIGGKGAFTLSGRNSSVESLNTILVI